MKFFYGQEIDTNADKRTIEKLLAKYKGEPVTDDLKKRIYHELVRAKFEGKILTPFKVVMRRDAHGVHRDYIEVILDTKV